MEFVFLPDLLFFDPADDAERQKQLVRERNEATQREERLFCAQCHRVITHQNERVVIQGSQEHSCTNPYGITFHIGCFRHAQGCAVFGTSTAADTWFSGYKWRIAICGKCETHLGWEFTSAADRFYGLIVSRLTSVGPAKN